MTSGQADSPPPQVTGPHSVFAPPPQSRPAPGTSPGNVPPLSVAADAAWPSSTGEMRPAASGAPAVRSGAESITLPEPEAAAESSRDTDNTDSPLADHVQQSDAAPYAVPLADPALMAGLIPPNLPAVVAPPPIMLPVTAPQVDAVLRERLLDTVQQLMVSMPSAHGAADTAQVRMVLHEAVLPGTAVTVQQTGAQLQVSFECTVAASRLRLDRAAPAFAQTLARRLGRDVVVRVDDDTGDALAPVHARADASEGSL